MFSLNYVLILGSVAAIACGQVMFKYAAQRLSFTAGDTYVRLIEANLHALGIIVAALALYMLSTVAWIQALRSVPLSVAFMFNALAFVLVPMAAVFIFGESWPRYYVLGMMMIVGGIVLISLN